MMQNNLYQNPYMQYQQPIMQNQNPYLERLQNLQQYQQSLQQNQMQHPQQNFINGKIVDSIDVVKATDIPMDGNFYYFPKADGTEIYAKSWLSNGTTRILTFKPFFDDDTMNLSLNDEKSKIGLLGEFTDGVMKRFDTIEERFDKFEKFFTGNTSKNTTSRTKKEGAEQ